MGKVDVGGGKPLGPPPKVPVAAPPPKRIAPPPKQPTPGPAPKHVAPTGYSRTRPSPKTPDRGPRPKAPAPRNPGGDVQSGGYNFQRANRFKQTSAYRNAIQAVFARQPVQQKLAIVQGLTHNNTWDTPEGHAIKDYSISHLSQSEMRILQPHIPIGVGQPSLFSELGHTLGKIIAPGIGNYGGKGKAGLPGGTIGSQYEMFGGPKGQLNLLKAGGQDLINLPAQTISTIGTIGGDVIGGHVGKAANDVIQPFVQAIKNPGAAIYGHPLDTYLMFGGGLHGASRVAAAPLRALARSDSLVGRAVSTAREGVALTGKLTHERPPFSRSPTVKAQQATVDKALYTRAPDGRLIPRSEQLRKHQMNQEIGSLVGVRERIRTVNREIAHTARAKAITPSKVRRAAHAAKTTLAYGPGRAAIPGASVLARIADATIRRPDTLAKDLQTHLDQVAANRPNLTSKHDLQMHDEYVRTLQKALQNKALLKNPHPAFKAAEAYGKDYRPVEAALAKLGHYRDMTSEQLQRSTLLHYAVTHMGARFDAERGTLVDTHGTPLSNQAILEHMKGPEGTGGRLPAFVSDRVRYDPEKQARGANYVSSERRPLPVPNQRNTLYAYTHGLTHPGHEALTEQHVLAQGILDSHRAMNHYVETLHTQLPGGGYARTHGAAEQAMRRAGITGYSPINTAEVFHPQESLNKAMENVSPAHIEEEAVLRSLNLEPLTQPGAEGRWGLIDNHAKKVLMEHQRQISPNTLLRTIRGLNNQFRTVALATSAKHIPGVVQENLIRDIAQGVGFRSWVTGRRVLQEAAKVDPARAREVRTRLTGGQVAGMTEAGKPYHVSDHWAGTSVHPFLKALEISSKTPGTRQLRTVWRQWTKLVIRGTKRALEEQHQVAGLGKYMLREHGYAEAAKAHGMLGLVQRAMTLHGKLLDDAAKGLFNEHTAGQARAVIQQIYGKWTDLSPSAQTALMFSPFGLWWANSARFLARMPIDQPVKTGVLASATVGTQQERRAKGQDLFSPGALPLYEQGGIAIGNKILAQNYYSPFGVANDPVATGQSLIQPWLTPIVTGALGVNWLGRPLSSPKDPHGRKDANQAARAQYILNSVLSSFVPLYTKAQQVAEGGQSAYDVNGSGLFPFPPATKKPGGGAGEGLAKALQPFRTYKAQHPKGSSSSSSGSRSSGGGFWEGTSGAGGSSFWSGG